MTTTLYDLTKDFLFLMEMLLDPDCDPQIVRDTMEGLDGEYEAKAEGYAKIMANLEAEADAVSREIERLKVRKMRAENARDHLKIALQESMIATGKRKFKTPLYSFSISKNPARVVIDNEADVPEIYKIPQPAKIDKSMIKLLLTECDASECTFAHMEQSEGLRIR